MTGYQAALRVKRKAEWEQHDKERLRNLKLARLGVQTETTKTCPQMPIRKLEIKFFDRDLFLNRLRSKFPNEYAFALKLKKMRNLKIPIEELMKLYCEELVNDPN